MWAIKSRHQSCGISFDSSFEHFLMIPENELEFASGLIADFIQMASKHKVSLMIGS